MPVAKKNKVNKVSAREEEVDEEEEEIEEPEEEEESEEETEESESEGSASDTGAKPRKPRSPNGPPIPWNTNLEIIVGKTMKRIESNKLRGALTPRVVIEHLKSHPAFEDFADRLTVSGILSRVKAMNAALTEKGFDPLPEFEVRQKRDVAALGAALAEDDEE